MTHQDDTQPVSEPSVQEPNSTSTETSAMASTTALTPINGTNGYQQQISIDSDEPLHLSVSNASGEVRISSSNQAGVWVVVKRTDGGDNSDDTSIPVSVDVDGNNISVHPDWSVASGFSGLARKIKDQLQNGLNPGDWDLSKFRLSPDQNYDIRVEIPRSLASGSKVSAKTASGKLSVSDVEADIVSISASGAQALSNVRGVIVSNSASGRIDISEAYGSLEANSASGAISVSGGEAWTALRTVSGSIKIDAFTMKNARLATVSGSVKGNVVADNNQEYAISTVSGSVKVDVTSPAGVTSRATIKSASGSGEASGDWVAENKRSWKMGSGEPGPVFNVKTVSGSFRSTGHTDQALTARNEPLPTSNFEDGDDTSGHFEGHGASHTGSGHDIDVNVDQLTSWAKDFAADFKKNFKSLATPPEPFDPVRPTPPTPPTPPETPTSPLDFADADVQRARAEEQRGQAEEQRAKSVEERAAAVERRAESVEARAAEVEQRNGTGSIPAQPWTWSTSSGSTPPTDAAPVQDAQSTTPVASQPTRDAAPETQGAANDSDTERLRVLEALERGEIDIDEALAKLDTEDAQGS